MKTFKETVQFYKNIETLNITVDDNFDEKEINFNLPILENLEKINFVTSIPSPTMKQLESILNLIKKDINSIGIYRILI